MTAAPVIVARDLTRRFGKLLAVDRLNLEVFPGEVFGFLGHNGAGKTTTIRLLNGVLSASDGGAEVLGLDPVKDGAALRRRTGVLTETPSLDERLTGRESLQIHANIYNLPRSEISSRVDGVLEDFELADRADEKVAEYSSGMKQRLALARALLHSPDVLFLDEPTASLDPLAARRVHKLIARLSYVEKRTAFVCTHNLVEAQRLCDRVAVLERGRLVALGTPAELGQELGRGLRLEIEVAPDRVAKAVDIADAVPGTTGLSVGENGLITLAVADREVISMVAAALVAGGVSIYGINRQDPSLEDIYFALHGEEETA
jgi:ABC-2 type transport system ATP-binding protein